MNKARAWAELARARVIKLVRANPWPLALAGIAAMAYLWMSWQRHATYGSGMDIGIFDQTIRGYSHLQIVPNTIQLMTNLLAEHFHPLLMLLAPLYWLWSDPRMLLIVQALALAGASLPIYAYAKEKLGTYVAVKIQLAFLSFWGIVAGNIYDFHEVALGVPIISLAIYAALKRKNALLWIMVVLGLLVKENMGLIFLALGMYLIVAQRRWWLGAGIMAVSTMAFVLTLKLMSSGVMGSPYKFWMYPALGSDALEAIKHLIRHPLSSFRIMFDQPAKSETILALLAPWLFLPLISPLFLLALPTLAERFLSDRSAYWTTYFHYSLTIAPILAFATIDTLQRLKQRFAFARRTIVIAELITLMLVLNMVWLSDRREDFNRLLPQADRVSYDHCLEKIPAEAPVLASNGLISHLSHRENIFVIRDASIKGDYIAVDLRSTSELGTDEAKAKFIAKARGEKFGVICSFDRLVVLKRGQSDKVPLSEPINNLLRFYTTEVNSER